MGTPVDRSEVFTGAGSRSIQLSGRFIRVLAADASGVTITPHPGSPLLRYAGQDVDAGAPFRWFDVSVTVACTVKLCVSDTRQADNTTSVNATISATVGPGGTLPIGGDTACPNAASTPLLAGDPTRLAAIICAPVAGAWGNGTVRIGGAGVTAASGVEIAPGEKLTLATSAAISCYNNSGAAITLQVLPVKQ